MTDKRSHTVMALAIMTGCSISAAGAGAFVTNLITSNPSQIARGAAFAAVVPFAIGATCFVAAHLEDDDQ